MTLDFANYSQLLVVLVLVFNIVENCILEYVLHDDLSRLIEFLQHIKQQLLVIINSCLSQLLQNYNNTRVVLLVFAIKKQIRQFFTFQICYEVLDAVFLLAHGKYVFQHGFI